MWTTVTQKEASEIQHWAWPSPLPHCHSN